MAASYMASAFDPATLNGIANETFRVMKKLNADVIVARGLSGTVVATAVGAMFGVSFAIVRKPSDNGHSTEDVEVKAWEVWTVEGHRKKYSKWVIVDDFIASGSTINAIHDALERNHHNFEGECVGIILYNSGPDTKAHNGIKVYRVGRKDNY